MQMAYVSIDYTVVGAWVSPAGVALILPVAVATIRNKRAESFQFVTRERTTESKYLVPPLSSYVRYRESLPMLSDLVLQDYLKEDLTYSENKELAKQWQKYSSMKHPSSRPQEQIQQGQDLNVNQTTLQLNFFLSNFGNLLGRPGLGQNKMRWYKSTDPNAYDMS